jgi:hypothetical protein
VGTPPLALQRPEIDDAGASEGHVSTLQRRDDELMSDGFRALGWRNALH